MAGETTITIIGNLTADPELRWTQSGTPVADLTIASTPRAYDRQAGQWRDGETLFMRCSAWRDQAENIAAIRTGAGMSPAEWADALGVSEGTARDWEAGRRTPPAGACTDMWTQWLAWVKTQASALGVPAAIINRNWREPVAVLPADTPLHALRARGIMLQGRRFTLDPGPEIQHPTT